MDPLAISALQEIAGLLKVGGTAGGFAAGAYAVWWAGSRMGWIKPSRRSQGPALATAAELRALEAQLAAFAERDTEQHAEIAKRLAEIVEQQAETARIQAATVAALDRHAQRLDVLLQIASRIEGSHT